MGKGLRGVTVFALVIVTLFCGIASADTLTVGSSGCDYTKIQDAVDGASAGDTIVAYNGTYTENVWINNKDLTIKGEDRETTIINGGGSGDCVCVSSADVIIGGFTIKNASGYGIRATGSVFSLNNATIENCGGDAIHFNCGKSLTLRDSVLENCRGGLIYEDHSSYWVAKGNATIERNIIRNNNGSGLYVYLKDKGNNVIINDNIITNNTGYGVKCGRDGSYKIDSIEMRNNTIKDCVNDGVYMGTITDVNIGDITIENTGDAGLHVYCEKLTMNPPFSIKNASGYGIRATGSVFSLNNATIENCGGDAIHFNCGKSLTLRDSVLENCRGGLIYEDHSSYWVAKGNATIERNIIRNNNGSGLYVYLKDKGNNVIINDNIITNNIGYGVKCDHDSYSTKIDSIEMRNNIVKNSRDDGVYIVRTKRSTIVNNRIASNEGYGIILHSSDSSMIFHNNLVNNNPNAYDSNSASNDWYHPILLEGNYWSDYTGIDDGSGTGKHDVAGDGIGDTDIPYPGANYDHYPFANESCWTWPKLNTIQVHTDKISYGLNKHVTISCIVQNDTGVNISVDDVTAKIVKPDNSVVY